MESFSQKCSMVNWGIEPPISVSIVALHIHWAMVPAGYLAADHDQIFLYDVFFGPEISANGFERSNSKIPHDMLRCHRRCSWQYWHPSARKSTAVHVQRLTSVAKQSSRTVVNCLWEQVVDCHKYGLWGALSGRTRRGRVMNCWLGEECSGFATSRCVRCLLITERPKTPCHYRYQI